MKLRPPVLILLLLGACATRTAIERSREFARLGDTYNAWYVLDEEWKAQTIDGGEPSEALAAAHRDARLEFLRGRARDRIFQEKAEAALADLAELDAMSPDYPGSRALRDMALRKKATHAVRAGDESLLRKDYADAMAWYIEADRVWPGLEESKDGQTKVREATAAMTVRAQQQFLEAVRKLPEFRYIEVQWHAANVLHNVPDRDDAKELRATARRENAEVAFQRGAESERQMKFGAALVEYRNAQRTDATLPEIEAAIARMEKEMQAAALVQKAEKDMRAGRFDLAREQLAQAFELSVMTRNEIGALVIATKKREGEQRYQEARDLEVLGKKAEALAAFEALAKDWPDGLSDEKGRIDALHVDIDGATKEWADGEAAEAANDLPKALQHYEAVERFYPGWKDVEQRIERMRAAVEKQKAEGAGEGKPPEEKTEEKPVTEEKPPEEKPVTETPPKS